MKKLQKNERFAKLKLFAEYIYKFGVKMSDSYTAACAAQAAFFILLSIVPMVSLILAITTYLPYTKGDVLYIMMRFIPADLEVYISDIINDVYNGAGKAAISISAIAMLWSASKGIMALMDGFNSMYQIRQETTWLKTRLISIAYTIILVIVFAAVMSGYVVLSHYYKLYIKDVFTIESSMRTLFLMIRYIMGWFLFYAFILMMFVILPGGFGLPMGKEEKMNLGKRIKSQIPGAAFSSVAWLVISRVVIIYIDHFPTFSVMYGSLAGIVIAMLWLYFCMYSLFIGAVINYLLSKGYLTRVKKMLQ